MLTRLLASFVRGKRAPSKGFWVINSKRGAKNFYKGKGCAPTGKHTRKGGYITSPFKKPTYIVPSLEHFTVCVLFSFLQI